MNDPQSLFAQAKAAVERGYKITARTLLDELVFKDPKNEEAWLLLVEVVENENERVDCLQQVLAINPENAAAKQKYDQLPRPPAEPIKKAEPAAALVEKTEAALPLDVDEKVEIDPVANPSPYADKVELESIQSRIGWTRTPEAQEMYTEAVTAARKGNRRRSESLLDELVAQQPQDVQAWWVLSQVAADDEKVVKCLQQVLEVVPTHAGANKRVDEMRAKRVQAMEKERYDQLLNGAA